MYCGIESKVACRTCLNTWFRNLTGVCYHACQNVHWTLRHTRVAVYFTTCQASTVKQIKIADARLATQFWYTWSACRWAFLTSMCCHIFILSPITTQYTTTQIWFTKVRIQTLFVTPVCWLVSKVNRICWTLIHTSPR